MASLVTGWPLASRPTDGAEAPIESVNVSRLAARLVAQDLLSDEPRDEPVPAPFERPEATLQGQHASPDRAPITTATLFRFLKAASKAYLSLRFRSLQSIATTVSARRQRSASRTSVDKAALRDAVAVYLRLRPLAFTVRDKCLFDSLALLEFLAAEDMHPHWIIGVKAHPFTAHSWVQSGPLVLNDHHEHVRSYRPILRA